MTLCTPRGVAGITHQRASLGHLGATEEMFPPQAKAVDGAGLIENIVNLCAIILQSETSVVRLQFLRRMALG